MKNALFEVWNVKIGVLKLLKQGTIQMKLHNNIFHIVKLNFPGTYFSIGLKHFMTGRSFSFIRDFRKLLLRQIRGLFEILNSIAEEIPNTIYQNNQQNQNEKFN